MTGVVFVNLYFLLGDWVGWVLEYVKMPCFRTSFFNRDSM